MELCLFFLHSVVQLIYDQKNVTYTQHDKRLIIENILKTKAMAIWDKKKTNNNTKTSTVKVTSVTRTNKVFNFTAKVFVCSTYRIHFTLFYSLILCNLNILVLNDAPSYFTAFCVDCFFCFHLHFAFFAPFVDALIHVFVAFLLIQCSFSMKYLKPQIKPQNTICFTSWSYK